MKFLFNFRTPVFDAFSHSVIVLRDRAYLLLSWRMHQAGALRIRELSFKSRKRNGSAYIRLPAEHEVLEISLSTLWRTMTMQVPLKFETVDERVDIKPGKAFRDLTAEAIYRPDFRTNLDFQPVVTHPAVHKIRFHIINLQYQR